jgi:GTP-binding protein
MRLAIVGRPNVGKSTLFNRLLGRRRAITLDEPGITRDPIVEPMDLEGMPLDLVDTGGLGGEADIALADRVHEHTVRAIGASDILIVLFDARSGLGPLDRDTVDLVSRSGLPAIYVANKGEGRASEDTALEFCALGIDPPLVISAEHGHGISELRSMIADMVREAGGLPEEEDENVDDGEYEGEDSGEEEAAEQADTGRPCRVALVGRPNVGKSSLLNLLAGQMLSLVDNKPGTTRDVVDTEIERGGRRYLLLDTAGMRRPSRVEEGVERISVRRAIEAIDRADVVVLLVEPEEGITDQDARIARRAWDEGRALVVLVNKADLATEAQLARVESEMRSVYRTLSPVQVGRLSVKRRQGIDEAFALIDLAKDAHNRRLPTAEVNRILAEVGRRREPPVVARGRAKLFYGTQTGVRPPTISIFTNRIELPEEYVRFIERCFREEADFAGSPLRLRFMRRDSHGGREQGEGPARAKKGSGGSSRSKHGARTQAR